MRRFAHIVLGAAALMTAAVLIAGPAAAAAKHQPDGWVRTEGYSGCGTKYPKQGSWRGQNIYNTTALHQTATYNFVGAFVCSNDYLYFTLNIQNDGAVSDRFKVHAPGNHGQKYFHGTSNITAAVVAGTFKTPSVSPGSNYQIQLRTPGVPTLAPSTLVTITSVGDPTKSDAVKAKAIVTCGC